MNKPVTLRPILSEKAFMTSETLNTYIFKVPDGVNKFDVASAVIKQYKVGVSSVRLNKVAQKSMRAYRKRGKYVNASKSLVRKAYVTLNDGDKLPIFAESNDSTKVTKNASTKLSTKEKR